MHVQFLLPHGAHAMWYFLSSCLPVLLALKGWEIFHPLKQPGTTIEWNMTCLSYFIVHSLCTRDDPTYTKLEWLVYHILSFTVRAHATTRRIPDYWQVWSPLRLAPIIHQPVTGSSNICSQTHVQMKYSLVHLHDLIPMLAGIKYISNNTCQSRD